MTSSDVATPPRPVAARPPPAAAAAFAPRRHRVAAAAAAAAVVRTPTRMWSRFDAVGEIDIELGSTATPHRRNNDPAAVFDYESGGDAFGDDEDAAGVPVAVVGPPRLRRVYGGATRRALEF